MSLYLVSISQLRQYIIRLFEELPGLSNGPGEPLGATSTRNGSCIQIFVNPFFIDFSEKSLKIKILPIVISGWPNLAFSPA